jgi:NAD+ synthase (glutamine-hydrolysing)
MKLVKLGAAVVNQTPLDWQGNKANLLEAMEMGRKEGVSILCLPELSICGYGCEDAFLSPNTYSVSMQVLREVIPHTSGMIVSVGLPVYYEKAHYNAAALMVDGKLLGFAAKRYLAGDGLHYEPRWFKPWPEGHRGTLELDGVDYPIGDLVFECGDVKIGFEICEDAWVANRPGNQLAILSVDVILNPSASHFAFGKHEVRKRLVVEGSRAFGIAYLYTNLVGNEAGRAIYDGDAHIASGGELLASAERLVFADVSLTTAIVDIDANRMAQARTSSFRPVVGKLSESTVEAEFDFPTLVPEKPAVTEPLWERNPYQKEESFSRAVALGLFDYMRKSRSRGFVVSLSGGADSAAVSVLVALMVDFGVAELGLQGFKDKLSYIDSIQSCSTAKECVSKLLLCVYQATRNSGEVTRNAARSVAGALGAEYVVLDVDELVQGYTSLIEASMGRKLSWETDDIALQNIQARVRGPGVWMFANIRSALLLATSNRSEAAVGYATMDGDTCGGLSPIAGIDKAFLRTWLRWMLSKLTRAI